jgi:hypothetical protein
MLSGIRCSLATNAALTYQVGAHLRARTTGRLKISPLKSHLGGEWAAARITIGYSSAL